MIAYVYIALTIIFWGLWSFYGKLATKHNSAIVVSAFTNLIVPVGSIILLLIIKRKEIVIDWTWPAQSYIVATATVVIMGSLCYYLALDCFPASKVVSLTALYPAVTVFLAVVVLGETFTFVQGIGLLLILAGSMLIIGT